MASCFEPFQEDLVDLRLYKGEDIPSGPANAMFPIFHRLHEDQTRRRELLPFLQMGLDSLGLRLAIQDSISQICFDTFVETILARFGSISIEAESFLRRKPEIAIDVGKILEYVQHFLPSIDVSYSMASDFWQDVELPDFEVLEIVIKVNVQDYSQLQKLWKVVDERLYETLGSSAKNKIAILLERL